MVIAHDAVSEAGFASAPTVSHTCTGADRYLFAAYSGDRDLVVLDNTVTYNTVNMPRVAVADNSLRPSIYVFSLVAPATGANDVVASAFDADPKNLGGFNGTSYTGVDQGTPIGTFVTNIGALTPATVDVTGTTAGNVVVDFVCEEGGGIDIGAVGANQTERVNIGATDPENGQASSDEPAGGTITMSWTLVGGWATAAVELLIAAAAGDLEELWSGNKAVVHP